MKNENKQFKKDFLTLKDFTGEEIMEILRFAEKIKKEKVKYSKVLEGLNIALLFDKPSTRTRVSFEVGILQMGGNCLVLDAKTLQIGRGETYKDTAKIFNAYLDGVIIRTFKQESLEIMGENCNIPVINALTDSYHPCQILCDLFTLYEKKLLNKNGLKFVYVGDSNNVLNSLLIGFTKLGIDITVGCPEEYEPSKELMDYISELSNKTKNSVSIVNDSIKAVKDADVIYTDVWVSMGDEESSDKIYKMKPFQVNRELISYAKKDVKIMHCLPAHRELEITSEILDSENSIVWEQAENRLYGQKGLLYYLFNKL